MYHNNAINCYIIWFFWDFTYKLLLIILVHIYIYIYIRRLINNNCIIYYIKIILLYYIIIINYFSYKIKLILLLKFYKISV